MIFPAIAAITPIAITSNSNLNKRKSTKDAVPINTASIASLGRINKNLCFIFFVFCLKNGPF
ncbi:hypothetical protein A8C56_13280 [Niabella ginsenosidivorans]|uniref:Uncharacterized protein n=1 Tax=Niabella ginsenosidivorans TaxID=1176587 RepID=A0A1A9I560_9BACT|nr:hypothetical protein A8C56_13280 [Niabella ginsenosidivorans]